MVSLQNFLSYYLPTDTDLSAFLAAFEMQEVKKGKVLIKPGQLCDWIAYIEHGVFRMYYFDQKAQDVTLWLSFEDMVATDMWGFYTRERSWMYVEALEDSRVHFIHKKQLEDLYEGFPVYRQFGQKFAEEALTMVMERNFELQNLSPEDRYRRLLEKPEFMHKIPLKYLATWLGVTDTSLSRIRRKVK